MAAQGTVEYRRILVTGATGKQGGAVVKALLELVSRSYDFEILVLTRNAASAAAKSLATNPNVKVITGDLNHPSDVFEQLGGAKSVWGVFSVQIPDTKHGPYAEENKEYRQGVDLIDASLKYGVRHFVQSSVDRGGDNSDNNPTSIPHFITKHRIECHLKEKTKGSDMTYTILRPVAFMDMFGPNIGGRLMGAMLGQLGDKPLQFVASKDIGIFAVQALMGHETDEYRNHAISLAGDELTQKECNETFWKVLHRPMPLAYGFMASFLRWMIPEVDLMFQWFKDVGYGANIDHCRKLNSQMLDMAAYLKEESGFKQQ